MCQLTCISNFKKRKACGFVTLSYCGHLWLEWSLPLPGLSTVVDMEVVALGDGRNW